MVYYNIWEQEYMLFQSQGVEWGSPIVEFLIVTLIDYKLIFPNFNDRSQARGKGSGGHHIWLTYVFEKFYYGKCWYDIIY